MSLETLGVGGPPAVGATSTSKDPFIGVKADPSDASAKGLGQAVGLPEDPPWASVTHSNVTDTAPGSMFGQYVDTTHSGAPWAGTTSVQYPHYRESDVDNNLRNMSAETLAALQQQMATAGLITPKARIAVGSADDTTRAAYRHLLDFSNRYGIDQGAALQKLVENPIVGPTKTTAAAKSRTYTSTNTSTTLTPKIDAQTVVRQTMQKELGRDPTDTEYQDFVAQLNGKEKASPSVTVTKGISATGESNTQTMTTPSAAPSAAAFADQFVRQGKLGVERNTGMVAKDYFDAAMGVLGAGGSGASF